MKGKLISAKFVDSVEEAQRQGDGAFNGDTELRLRVTNWDKSLWVCAVEWYRRLDRKPKRTPEVDVRQFVLMPGRTVARVVNATLDDAKQEVVLILDVLPRVF